MDWREGGRRGRERGREREREREREGEVQVSLPVVPLYPGGFCLFSSVAVVRPCPSLSLSDSDSACGRVCSAHSNADTARTRTHARTPVHGVRRGGHAAAGHGRQRAVVRPKSIDRVAVAVVRLSYRSSERKKDGVPSFLPSFQLPPNRRTTSTGRQTDGGPKYKCIHYVGRRKERRRASQSASVVSHYTTRSLTHSLHSV